MKRLFVAIKFCPDENTLREYNLLRSRLQFSQIRWVEPDKFHLTLKFIGNISDEKIPNITDVINNTLKSFDPFHIQLGNLGIFGSTYQPRVIWLGINDKSSINKLGIAILSGFDKAGFGYDRQNFVPHISLGRISKVVDKTLFNKQLDKSRSVFKQTMYVNKVFLIESVLQTKGSIYTDIYTCPLTLL